MNVARLRQTSRLVDVVCDAAFGLCATGTAIACLVGHLSPTAAALMAFTGGGSLVLAVNRLTFWMIFRDIDRDDSEAASLPDEARGGLR